MAATSSSGPKCCGVCHAPMWEAAPASDLPAPAGSFLPSGPHRPALLPACSRAPMPCPAASGCCLPHSGAGAEYETDAPQQFHHQAETLPAELTRTGRKIGTIGRSATGPGPGLLWDGLLAGREECSRPAPGGRGGARSSKTVAREGCAPANRWSTRRGRRVHMARRPRAAWESRGDTAEGWPVTEAASSELHCTGRGGRLRGFGSLRLTLCVLWTVCRSAQEEERCLRQSGNVSSRLLWNSSG